MINLELTEFELEVLLKWLDRGQRDYVDEDERAIHNKVLTLYRTEIEDKKPIPAWIKRKNDVPLPPDNITPYKKSV